MAMNPICSGISLRSQTVSGIKGFMFFMISQDRLNCYNGSVALKQTDDRSIGLRGRTARILAPPEKARQGARTKFGRPLEGGTRSGSPSKVDWTLCLIADPEFSADRNIPAIVEDAVRSGVTLVQLRAKNLSCRDFLDLALNLTAFLNAHHIPLIINDRVDIALACRASGVHLGQDDLPLPLARQLLGPDKIIGISVNSREEAVAAEKQGADYLGVGPVYPTSTKKDLRAILGLPGLKAISETVRIPILAIGGITAENAGEVMASGADGVAVISAILGAEDISQATRKLLEAIQG